MNAAPDGARWIPLASAGVETVEYLRDAQRRMPAGPDEVLARQDGFAGRVLPLAAGLIALSACAALMTPFILSRYDLPIEARAAAVGALLLLGVPALRAGLRNLRGPYLGHFLLVDGAAMWEVRGRCVRATPRGLISGVRCVHSVAGGRHQTSTLVLRTGAEERQITLRRMLEAEAASAALLRPVPSRSALKPGSREPVRAPTGRPWAILRVMAIGAIASGAALLVPPLWGSWDQRVLFRGACASKSESSMWEYLLFYPTGPHADEAARLRDDLSWEQTRTRSARDGSAKPLREYLAARPAPAHADEARAALKALYECALADLRAGSGTAKDRSDGLDVLTALLERMEGSENPVVTIAFSPVVELPDAPAEVETGLRILPHAEAFADARGRAREEAIVRVLRTAFDRIVSRGLVDFRAAAAGENPMMTVSYRVWAPGNLYTISDDNGDGNARPRGLVLGCGVDWEISVLDRFHFVLESRPASSIRMRLSSRDPDWAPYAILMHSACLDMAAQVAARLGGMPPAEPPEIRYSDIVGR